MNPTNGTAEIAGREHGMIFILSILFYPENKQQSFSAKNNFC